MKTIVIRIAPDGTVTLETRGYAGDTCLAASRFLEIALGTTTAEQSTPERHQQTESLPLEQRH